MQWDKDFFVKLWQTGFFSDIAIIFVVSLVISALVYAIRQKFTSKIVVDLGNSGNDTWIIKN
jgi:hypothetical protein